MSRRKPDALQILRDASEAQIAEAKAELELGRVKQAQTIAELRRQVRAMALQIGVQDDQIAAYEALLGTAIRPGPKLRKARRRRRAGDPKPLSVIAASSDWHTHELVDLPENRHDPDVGRARAWRWAERLTEMVQHLQKRSRVESLVWWWGGDFMCNAQMPHYDAILSVGLSPQDEALGCRDLLVQITHEIRRALPDLRIHITTSWGNHERSTPKMEPGIAKDYTHSRIIYGDAARWFAQDEMIDFHVATDEVTITDVHGWKLATHHGHNIRFSDAVGGIATAANKLLLRMMKQGLTFDGLLVGHWHRIGMEAGTRVFTNGSLVGVNRYAKNLNLGTEPPAQCAIVLDLERLEVADWWRIWGE